VIVFDIETGPLPLSVLRDTMPSFDIRTVPHPGVFDPGSVKLGNIKDAALIAKKIEEAKAKHEEFVANYPAEVAKAEQSHWLEIAERGALSAVTGQVAAIGYRSAKGVLLHAAIGELSEKDIITYFWNSFLSTRKQGRLLVGFNIKGFDIPFLCQRSWILGVDVPDAVFTQTGYVSTTFVDLQERWKAGNRFNGQTGFGTLDTICRACGLPGKPDDCKGADFARMLWSESEEDQQAALGYLKNDLEMTYALAERLGVH
jgi:hypothetical protein